MGPTQAGQPDRQPQSCKIDYLSEDLGLSDADMDSFLEAMHSNPAYRLVTDVDQLLEERTQRLLGQSQPRVEVIENDRPKARSKMKLR